MRRPAIILLFAITLIGGCKSPANKAEESVAAASTPLQYSEPPMIDRGLSAEQAYAAIPHRRTIWIEGQSAVPAEEKAYLKVMFQVLDQAVAVRVASLQRFSSERYDASDTDAQFDQLIKFVRAMPVPKALTVYHKHILDGFSGQRQFFQDWKSARERFAYAQQIAGHPGVRNSSEAIRAAYDELMSKYPRESATNKDAFFDYHCAWDFL